MHYLRSPNCTFDFYVLPNLPPAAPDITSSGFLRTWFFPGMQVNIGVSKYFFDSALDVLLTDQERDPWPAAPGAYRVYIPDKWSQGYDVVFIERFRLPGPHQRGHTTDFKRIFLKRRVWSVTTSIPNSLRAEGGLTLAGTAAQSVTVKTVGGLTLGGTATHNP